MTQELVSQGMQEELLNRLDALAAKLGVGGEHLWEVLLQQAQVEAWFYSLWAVLGAAVLGAGLIGIAYFIKEEAAPIFILPIFAGAIIFIPCLHRAFTAFYNPEYWALQKIMETIQ